MNKIPNLRGSVLLLLTLWFTASPLIPQVLTPAHARSGFLNRQDAEYQLSEAFVNGIQVTFPVTPSPGISFYSGGVISGFAGVNQYFGKVDTSDDGSFRIAPPGLATTKLASDIPSMSAEAAFLSILEKAAVIHFENDGVRIETADRMTRLMFLRVAAAQELSAVLNVELVLARFTRSGKETALPSDHPITLTFLDGGRFSGRATVNSYGGGYTTTPDGKITLQSIVSTQMAGAPELMAIESAYLDALPAVRQFRIETGRVFLENDTTVLEFSVRNR